MIRRPGVQLFLISCFALYLELIGIRWLASEVRAFAYLKNIPLIVSFLGLGLGIMADSPRRSMKPFLPFVLTIFILALAFAPLSGISLTPIPSSDDLWVWWSSEAHAASSSRSLVALPAFMVIVAVFLFLLFALFFGVGEMIRERLQAFPPLQAYSIDLLGSMAGVLLFTLVSFFHFSPLWWFVIGFLIFFLMVRPKPAFLLPSVTALAYLAVGIGGTYWSPYYRIELIRRTLTDHGELASVALDVNHVFFQQMGNHSDEFLRRNPQSPMHTTASHYNLPYKFITNPGEVLVVGAGTGNDVAAALRHGARRVDAVDIDPLIVRLGRQHHPEAPYRDIRVRVIVDDARSFFGKSEKQYDTVVYGLLDSHTSVSVFSSVRLDNFVYTLESFQAAQRHLKDNGNLVLSFAAGAPWILARLETMLRETFQQEPLVFRRLDREGGMFLVGRTLQPAALNDPAIRPLRMHIPPVSSLTIPTDDWPYLYLRQRRIPLLYLITLLLVALVFVVTVWYFLGSGAYSQLLLPRNRELWHFFLLGAGFLLIQTKSINELSLMFGSTWVVNSSVIFGILAMAWLANHLVRRGVRLPVPVIAAGLMAALVLGYVVRPAVFSGQPFLAKFFLGGFLIALPLFFSGLLFSRSFEHTQQMTRAFGANLYGAFAGGMIENVAMITGIRALALAAIAIYGAAVLLRPQGKTAD
jgi:hypothetical protein